MRLFWVRSLQAVAFGTYEFFLCTTLNKVLFGRLVIHAQIGREVILLRSGAHLARLTLTFKHFGNNVTKIVLFLKTQINYVQGDYPQMPMRTIGRG